MADIPWVIEVAETSVALDGDRNIEGGLQLGLGGVPWDLVRLDEASAGKVHRNFVQAGNPS